MATATTTERTFHIVLTSKSKTAKVQKLVAVAKGKTYTEAAENARNLLKSPTRWTT